ncbi:MAG: hypothetical protein P4L80_02695 [Xanthobacteraceae bacterium]|nr:hypothetical protein [Xanthobacteraceae bacterium]
MQPFIDFSFVRKPFDVSNFGPWIVGFNLPIVFGDPLHFENDTFFSHKGDMAVSGQAASPSDGRDLHFVRGSAKSAASY